MDSSFLFDTINLGGFVVLKVRSYNVRIKLHFVLW